MRPVLVCEALESQERRLHMVVKPHKSHNREKKALPQIGQFANSQVGRAVLHLYVTVKSLVTKKRKKKNKYWFTRFHCEYDVYWWAKFMSSLQDMWIGQSSSVKMTGKIGVVWEKSGTSFTTVEWITLKHSDGRCEGANHWQQLTLYCIHCCK